MLAEEIFTDATVNDLVAMLYPEVTEMLDEMIADLPSEYRYKSGFISITIDINILKTTDRIAQDLGLQLYRTSSLQRLTPVCSRQFAMPLLPQPGGILFLTKMKN